MAAGPESTPTASGTPEDVQDAARGRRHDWLWGLWSRPPAPRAACRARRRRRCPPAATPCGPGPVRSAPPPPRLRLRTGGARPAPSRWSYRTAGPPRWSPPHRRPTATLWPGSPSGAADVDRANFSNARRCSSVIGNGAVGVLVRPHQPAHPGDHPDRGDRAVGDLDLPIDPATNSTRPTRRSRCCARPATTPTP